MTVSKRDIYILIGFIGILAAVLVYFFLYKPNKVSIEDLKAKNETLNEEVTYLQRLKAREEEFTTQTALYETSIEEMFNEFPSEVRAEDAVQEGLMIQQASGVEMTDLTYGAPSVVYSLMAASIDDMPTPAAHWEDGTTTEEGEQTDSTEADSSADGSSDSPNVCVAMVQPVSYSFVCDLKRFMNAATYVGGIENRDVIDGLSLAYDSSNGLIYGKIELNKYYIIGNGKEYIPQTFDVPTGSMNLFSTIILPDVEAEQENGEAEEND